MSSGVFPLYIGKSKDDQELRAHLDKMIAEGGNASQWVKGVLLAAIKNGGALPASPDDKLDAILEILRSGQWTPGEQTNNSAKQPPGDDTKAIQDWLAAAESSFE